MTGVAVVAIVPPQRNERASGTPRPTPQGRISACSCERLREIGDGTAQFVVFQFKERGHQARAMGCKRHVDGDRRLDLSAILNASWEFIEKILDIDL